MKLRLISISMIIVVLFFSITLSITANASSVTYSSNNIVLANGQNEFSVDLTINNDGKQYSGAQISMNLNGIELVSVNYLVQNYSSAGPVTKNGITTFGFYNTNNVYSDGKICTLDLKYTGNSSVNIVITETLISTRIDQNNLSSNKQNPGTIITVSRQINASGSNSSSSLVSSTSSVNSSSAVTSTASNNSISNSSSTLNNSQISNISSAGGKQSTKVFAPSDKIPTDDIINTINSSDVDIEVNLTKPDVIQKEIFDKMRGQDRTIEFNVVDENGKVTTWTIYGKDINNATKNVDLSLTYTAPQEIQDKINNLVGNKKSFSFTFANNDVLPCVTKIRLYVGASFLSGELVNLYYYNQQTDHSDLVANQIKIDANGYATFSIAHCSTYFITNQIITDAFKDIPIAYSVKQNTNELLHLRILLGVSTVIILFLICIVLWQRSKMSKKKV